MRTQFVYLNDAAYYAGRDQFVRKSLEAVAQAKHGFKLLDVGNLGDGKNRVNIQEIVEDLGGEHCGLDVNKNLAQKLGYKYQLIGDLHDLRGVVDDCSFDVVYAGEIIEHTWEPGRMIKECARILKPTGVLVLDTPNVYSLINVLRLHFLKRDSVNMDDAEMVYQEAKDNMKDWREQRGEVQSQPQHKILYSPAMLRQLMNMHGFAVERFAFIGLPDHVVYKVLLHVLPRGAQKIGLVAKRESLEDIFNRKHK